MPSAKLASLAMAVATLVACTTNRSTIQAMSETTPDPAIIVRTVEQQVPWVGPAPTYPSPHPTSLIIHDDRLVAFQAIGSAREAAASAMLHSELSARAVPPDRDPSNTVNAANAEGIVTALVRAGVEARRIFLVQTESAIIDSQRKPGSVQIYVTLDHPTASHVRELGKVINDASGYPAYHAFSDIVYRVNHCNSLLARARAKALRDASAQAHAAVPGPHPRLGPIADVSEDEMLVSSGSCGDSSGAQQVVYRKMEDPAAGYVVVTDKLSVAFPLIP